MSETRDIYWFADADNSRDSTRHISLVNKLREELERSDDDAVMRFKGVYDNEFPPSWMISEVCSFGTLSMIYRWLKAGRARRNVARFYGLSDTVMESWLHSIVYVRNICAHHSRLWNRRLSINAIIPRNTHLPFIIIPADNKRTYYVMSILLYFMQTVNPQNTFAKRIKALLSKYPKVDMSAVGFSVGWEREILWRQG